jgi:hypothetical protein
MSTLLWLEESGLSVWIREYPGLLGFPFILFLHTLGLAMVAGISIAVDIWLLRNRTLVNGARMKGLIQTMWLGFGINTVSGVALLLAYPAKALTNPVFFTKMLLVGVGVYAIARIKREMFPTGLAAPGAAVTAAARHWATTSLVVWAGAIVTGRLLAYTYHVLLAQDLP